MHQIEGKLVASNRRVSERDLGLVEPFDNVGKRPARLTPLRAPHSEHEGLKGFHSPFDRFWQFLLHFNKIYIFGEHHNLV